MKLPAVKLHDINTVFWVGSVILGVFGVGRFMIGDKLIGALKLTLIIISYILLAISYIMALFPNLNIISIVLMIMGYVGLAIVTIWWGLDIFMITSKAKRANLNRILYLFQS